MTMFRLDVIITVGLFIREHDYCIRGEKKNSLIMCAIIPSARGRLRFGTPSDIYIRNFP